MGNLRTFRNLRKCTALGFYCREEERDLLLLRAGLSSEKATDFDTIKGTVVMILIKLVVGSNRNMPTTTRLNNVQELNYPVLDTIHSVNEDETIQKGIILSIYQ